MLYKERQGNCRDKFVCRSYNFSIKPTIIALMCLWNECYDRSNCFFPDNTKESKVEYCPRHHRRHGPKNQPPTSN